MYPKFLRGLQLSLFFLLTFTCGQAQSNVPLAFEEREVSVATPQGALYGSLLVPSGIRKPPVALIIAGSGPTDRNGNNLVMQNNSLKMLAFALKDQGIASLRFDKYGVGASATLHIPEDSLLFEDFVGHVGAWIDFLADQKLGSLYLVGHSEGSLLAILAAQQHPKQVRGLVSIAGAGLPIADVLREQLQYQPPAILVPALAHLARLEAGLTVDSVHPFLYSLFRPSIQPYLISWMAYHPALELSKLDMKALIVQGTHDLQVPVHHADSLHRALPTATLEVIDGMNHILKAAPMERAANLKTYNEPETPLEPSLVPLIANFVKLKSGRK